MAFVGDAQSPVSPEACNEKVAIIARYVAHLTIHFKHSSHTLLELSACSYQVLAVLIEAMVYVGIIAKPVGAANV